jgi:hypothetical protein
MTGKLSGNIRLFLLMFLMLTGAGSLVDAQVTSIGGSNLNQYAHVDAVGIDNVIVNDPTQFSYFQTGDIVLLIQMKGISITTDELPSYGTINGWLGTPGGYEFLTISNVEAFSKKITFNNYIAKTYDPLGDVQLIRVPAYYSANVTTPLTCAPWDSTSKTGGVLAIIVWTKLTLNDNVSVTGMGFNGGKSAIGLGQCARLGGNDNYSYNESFGNSGYKGESPASLGASFSIYPYYVKGKGRNYMGGGGANGNFSGGGGGSYIGSGGKGGKENNTCFVSLSTDVKFGGLGALKISTDPIWANLFMGGGGGGPTYLTGATTTNGGNGGGIVFIICETLEGNSKSVSAGGQNLNSVTVSGNTGSGGGGAGGTVALYTQNISSNVTLAVPGGGGGSTANTFGEGGGGGGGRIALSSYAGTGIVTKTLAGGLKGSRSGVANAENGTAGRDTAFIPLLNGFLFNAIKSSATQTLTDTICSNLKPIPTLVGTTPVGGASPYSYYWEFSTTSESAGFLAAPGTNDQASYTAPDSLSQTTWYRRTVTDNSSTPIVDVSKPVKMVVLQSLRGNYIGRDTTICYGQDPKKLYPLNSGPTNGTGFYKYQWQDSIQSSVWTNETGTSTNPAFDPSNLNTTTFFRRIVKSSACKNTSSVVRITVLPSITGNITARPDSVICQGSLFNSLGASAAGGGSGTYLYQWQQSADGSTSWSSAPNTSTNTTYTVDTTTFTPLSVENMYYRRVVFSGLNNTCQSNSVPIHMTRYHKIGNNIIAADQTICSGSVPAAVTGSTPTYGNLSYTYQWQDSSQAATWTTQSVLPGNSYAPSSLTNTTWYRRVVNSSKCTNTSKKIKVLVHQPVVGNNIALLSGPGPDTTICNGATPNRIAGPLATALSGGTGIAGDFAFQWSSSTDGTTFTDIASGGTLHDYQPGSLTQTTWFRRKAQSGMCSSISGSVRVIVLPLIAGNTITTAKNTVCYGLVPSAITTSGTVTGGSGAYTWLWQESNDGTVFGTASGTSTNETYNPPALTTKKWYKRIVNSGPSGCCTSVSNVLTIDILTLPTATITTTSDTTLCSTGKVRLKVTLTGASGWTVKYNEGATQVTEPTISSATTTILRTPGSSASPATLIYSIASVVDANGCVATSITGTRKAFVYTMPVANPGPDVEICGRKFKMGATPTAGTGLWTFPSRAHTPDPTLPGAVISIDTFNTAFDTITFFWKETNWTCISSSKVKLTFDNQVDAADAGKGGAVMTFDKSFLVKAVPVLSFESGKWTVDSGTGNFVDDTSDSTYVRGVEPGRNIYRWNVTNRLCSLSDTVLFNVSEPVVPEGLSPDGNGINDTLKITGLDYETQDIDLKIINGAGALVFSAYRKAGTDGEGTWTDWTGHDMKGKPLPEGTYYYLLKVYTPELKNTAMAKGFIILKRN